MRIFAAAVIAALAFQIGASTSAFADNRCLRETQTDLTICYRDLHSAADDNLNAAYRWLVDALQADPTEVDNLRAAQRGWVIFRDAECHFRGSSARGGSMESMLINICLLDMTEARTDELIEALNEARGR